ncbi:MAG TPA: DUF465 domain-containing protein [Polyangiales bacterium]|jgi:uncharacterized protein YdcH (DUF465 family)
MQKMSRKLESQFELDRLVRRHGALKEQIAELDRQRYLSVAEQIFLQDLKKQKLATKDLLFGLRRRFESE